jgi:hydrogenase-4 component F
VTELLAIATLGLPLLGAAALAAIRRRALAARVQAGCALATAAVALALAWRALDAPVRGGWLVADAASAVLLPVVAVVGLLSALALAGAPDLADAGLLRRRGAGVAFQLFWAALLAVPLAANLAVAWLLVEATTAASALLVASGGGRGALEAAWKYLVLTTLGLTVALLGVVVLFAALGDGRGTLHTLDWDAIHAGAAGLASAPAVTAALLLLAGLAAKVGWAPVHNWLPDAHSEAPPAVSALLSAALLPAVVLVTWRLALALAPSPAGAPLTALLTGFGLASLAVAVPFLWRPMPLKRLLAYSSLEHMGVLALGIAFATPLAIAGVVLHVAGHALAKALGFYAAIPLLRRDAGFARRPPVALPAASPAAAGAVAVSLATLAGLPPAPLFFSELLILAGGVAAGKLVVVAVAAALLALGFLGLAHAAIEALAGERAGRPAARAGAPRLVALTAATGVALLALSACALMLPDSQLVARLVAGLA